MSRENVAYTGVLLDWAFQQERGIGSEGLDWVDYTLHYIR